MQLNFVDQAGTEATNLEGLTAHLEGNFLVLGGEAIVAGQPTPIAFRAELVVGWPFHVYVGPAGCSTNSAGALAMLAWFDGDGAGTAHVIRHR